MLFYAMQQTKKLLLKMSFTHANHIIDSIQLMLECTLVSSLRLCKKSILFANKNSVQTSLECFSLLLLQKSSCTKFSTIDLWEYLHNPHR